MSCGNHHATDCSKVLARLAFFIDHELADADTSEIKQHLDECRPCIDEMEYERAIKALVARSCSEACPDGLRDRVMVRIREVQITVTEQP